MTELFKSREGLLFFVLSGSGHIIMLAETHFLQPHCVGLRSIGRDKHRKCEFSNGTAELKSMPICLGVLG